MIKPNFRLRDFFLIMMCFSIILFNGCFFTPLPNTQILNKQKKFADQEIIKNDKPHVKIVKPSIEENKTINPPATKQGKGYLSDGSALSMGVMDGDEEIKVLQKIKRLEARLGKEKNKVKRLNTEVSELKTAKESIEKDFADTKKEMEEKIANLLDTVKSLESKLKESNARVATAEQELASTIKELLKSQIIETRAQQELYKLKIENLKQGKGEGEIGEVWKEEEKEEKKDEKKEKEVEEKEEESKGEEAEGEEAEGASAVEETGTVEGEETFGEKEGKKKSNNIIN